MTNTIKFHIDATTKVNGCDVDWERELEVGYDHIPAERMTYHFPGFEEAVEVVSITTEGPMGVEDFYACVSDRDMDRIYAACWDDVAERKRELIDV